MSDELIVYYATGASKGIPDTGYEPLGKKALSVMQTDEKIAIRQCPAFRDNFKNTFCVTNPKEFKLSLRENQEARWFIPFMDGDNDDFDVNNFVLARSDRSFSLTYGHMMFWCEEPLEMVQLHPSFTYSDLALKTELMSGSFDISKWFRPLDCAYTACQPNTDLEVKKGDPLYFVRFNTNKKVLFKRFYFSEELREFAKTCVRTRALESNFFNRLKNYYDAAASINLNKRVTKAIKKELFE